MDDRNNTEGRKANGAMPLGKPDRSTSDAEVKRNGERERRSAGPDGPDAREVGDTFKKAPKNAPGG